MGTQLIRLTLLDGDPEGLRSVSVAGRTTLLTGCPWPKLQSLLARPEAARPAVYLMLGRSFDDAQEVVYIGECDSLANRFKQHHKEEAADWTEIFSATTTESTFNKAHARLAEHLLVQRAKDIKRASVLTSVTSPGVLDEGDRAFTAEFVENVVILTQILGSLLFRPMHKVALGETSASSATSYAAEALSSTQPVVSQKFEFYYTQTDIKAEMIPDGKFFVLLKGSQIAPDKISLGDSTKILRAELRQAREIVAVPDSKYEVLQKDLTFPSTSAAGAFVYGASCAGPSAWRTVDRKQLYKDWAKNAESLEDMPS